MAKKPPSGGPEDQATGGRQETPKSTKENFIKKEKDDKKNKK